MRLALTLSVVGKGQLVRGGNGGAAYKVQETGRRLSILHYMNIPLPIFQDEIIV